MKLIEYVQSFTIPENTEMLYHKRRWVPNWLWRRVAVPDTVTLIRLRMKKAKQQYEDSLLENFHGKGISSLLNNPPAE